MIQTNVVTVNKALGLFALIAFVGIAASTGLVAANHDSEDAPGCEEAWWEDYDDECDDWERTERPTTTTAGTESDYACEEPAWRDDDTRCDRWSDTNDGSATTEVGDENLHGPTYEGVESMDEAVEFKWWEGNYKLDPGPTACIDFDEVGGKQAFLDNKHEYAEYIMEEGSWWWEEYTTEEEIIDEIERHYYEWDGSGCITIWETGLFDNNMEKPDHLDRSDWTDPDG